MIMDKTKEQIAWENAPEINNKNPNQYKNCYICGESMNKGDKWRNEEWQNQYTAWDIDHKDGNRKNNNKNNLIAVHRDCNLNKS